MQKRLLTIVLFATFSITAFSQQPPNGTFENWTADSLPANWEPNNSGDSLRPCTWTNDSHTGNYALLGQVFEFNGGYVPPVIHTAGNNGLGANISFRYVALTGWYKAEYINGDHVTVQIAICTNGGLQIGIGYVDLVATSTYTRFYIPIGYINNSPARFARVDISMATNTPPFSLGSYYIFDDINLEVVSGISDPIPALTFSTSPNPSNKQIQLTGNFNPGQQYDIRLMNILGKSVLETKLKPASSFIPPIEVGTLPEGFYMLLVTDSRKTYTQRVLISH